MNLKFSPPNKSKMFPLIILSSVLILQIPSANGYPDGAPATLCEDMKPKHSKEPMSVGDLPFTVTHNTLYIRNAGKIRFTVTSKDSKKFTLAGALFVMKRRNDKRKAYGSFDPKPNEDDLKTIDCFGKVGSRSGLTHSHAKPKTKIVFHWIAPNVTSAEYELHATFVRDYNSFWADYIYPHKIMVDVKAPASSGRIVYATFSLTLLIILVSLSLSF